MWKEIMFRAFKVIAKWAITKLYNYVDKDDDGKLSKDEIEKMVNDSYKYAEEDMLLAECIEAKNKLETFLYQIRNSSDDMKDRMDPIDHQIVSHAVDETLRWIDEHPQASKEDFKEKQNNVEHVWNPIIQKLTSGANINTQATPEMDFSQAGTEFDGMQSTPVNNIPNVRRESQARPSGPTIEEVD